MGSVEIPLPNGSRVHEGKLAIVTGSARSIGAAIVRNLASKGCNVIVNHATEGSDKVASELCNELETTYRVKAIWVRGDVSKRDDCTKIVEAAKANFRNPQTGSLQIDILVHNAGIFIAGPLETVLESDFERLFAVNVLGPTLLTAACLPHLPTDRSGRVVIVSSIASKVGNPNMGLYAGTKGAVEAMARVWCRELAERATVNTINPGPVMNDLYLSSGEHLKSWGAQLNRITPLAAVRPSDSFEVREVAKQVGGRPAHESEIAGVVATLCSPDAAWCTGSLVCANGGTIFSY
ncbi:3-oxoacyl-acyl-carrier-protein reductase [Hypomontagnella monticulosa]|nr:3-oxoacyl-acyl-carrier-protein reductase [Hypomontagnella monticulosa]